MIGPIELFGLLNTVDQGDEIATAQQKIVIFGIINYHSKNPYPWKIQFTSHEV